MSTSSTKKPQRAFLAATLITVLAVAAVFMVYAVILSTITGGNVEVTTASCSIWYDDLNASSTAAWTSTLSSIGNGSTWYAKLNTTSAGYHGDVNITWTLQVYDTDHWDDVSPAVTQETNTYHLEGTIGQNVFASSTGNQDQNKDWGASTTTAGTYRVKAVIEQV